MWHESGDLRQWKMVGWATHRADAVIDPEQILWRSKVDGSERLQLNYLPARPYLPRWSPDGKTIALYQSQGVNQSKVYLVSRNGGSPRLLLPDDPKSQMDPTWSPDGSKMIFGRNSGNPASTIRIFDIATHQLSTVPCHRDCFHRHRPQMVAGHRLDS